MQEQAPPPNINHEKEPGVIIPPEDSYFIHGVKNWSREDRIGIRSPEVSASLQKDGHTRPLRPYGYILKVDRGGITKAFDRDVTSGYDESYEKILKPWSSNNNREYNEENLLELLNNTRAGSHNELWLQGEKAEIVGAYITEVGSRTEGVKNFMKACKEEHIPVRVIKTSDPNTSD